MNSESDAEAFGQLVQAWAIEHGAVGEMHTGDHHERCPECGKAMVYDGTLDAYVCGHVEESASA